MSKLKKIVAFLKKWVHHFFENIGTILLMIVVFSFFIIIGRFFYYNSKFCWLLFLVCPIIAFTNRKVISVILYCTFFLTVFLMWAIVASPKNIIYAESVLIKGHQGHYENFVAESTQDGDYYPAHYETIYTFTPNPNQSETYVSLIKNLIQLFPVLNLAIVWFILRKRLFK